TGARLRAVAAETVDEVVTSGRSLDAAIAKNESRVPAAERSLLRLLSYGVLRHHWQLEAWINQLLARPFKRKDSAINALLSVGLFQLTETRIPDHAAVSQTVDATRQLRRPKLAGVVNACLRRFQRDKLAERAAVGDEARWNHPQWLIDTVQRDWPDEWQAILAANNRQAPMWLRVNGAKTGVDGYREKLRQANIEAAPLAGVPDALRLAEPCAVGDLPGFFEGEVSVQDAAAQLAARWLLSRTGGSILDACAAPGGKSGHLLELGGDDIRLVAVDRDKQRVKLVTESLSRIGRDATVIAADASTVTDWWDGTPFDGILLDAPCSATGVIRRHPDIKLLRRRGDIEKLSRQQRKLLDALWPLLVPGGRLLYATCSVLAAENEAVVEQFLAGQPDAIEDELLPNNNIRDLMRRRSCGYQILPGTGGLDGFYYACLEKKVP
ncbi:MAG: 16S rRNA (cytosine(967)-C(5))-methyltransferase RsmB, partial [Gammaproteobacteria bacterium]|nr:16S rRNA (cytosine(967)-C(5))-methyltransferase RsmB [Gammaproteobacteria bacterium]